MTHIQKLLRCLAITSVLIFSQSSANADHSYSWPIYYPAYGVSVNVGYGYVNPWDPFSIWRRPYVVGGLYPYGFGYPVRYETRSFGAIAYSPTTNLSGFSHTAYSLYQANQLAMDFCAVDDCRPVVWASGGCAALSVGTNRLVPERTYVGWGYHYSKHQAIRNSLQGCQRGGDFCVMHTWMCTP